MEFLIPNEVARLVYGYLEEEGCLSAAKLFLETSSHLVECKKNVAKGRNFNTKILHLGLTEILDLLAEVTCYVKSIEQEACKKDVTLGEVLNQLKLTLKLGSKDETVNKPVYLRITMPSEPKKRKSKPSEVSTSQPSVVQETSQISIEDSPDSPVNQSHALQLLLENKALHEKLAENINKVVAKKSEVDSLERILEKKIVETIVNTTEKDPIFQEMLEELVGPVEATNSTPEDTEIETEDVAIGLQSVMGESQQLHAGGRTIVDRPVDNLAIVTSVPVSSHQELFTPLPQSSHIMHPMQPLVNAGPYQTMTPQGQVFGPLAIPAVPSTLSPQDATSQSYVFTTATGKVTVSSAMSPLRIGVTPGPPTVVTPSVVQSTPTARHRSIQPRPPTQSTIRVLHPSSHPLTGASMINVLPNTGSVLQGLLEKTLFDPAETVKVLGTPGSRMLTSPAATSPGVVGPLVRVGGVRTRGGKAKVVKTYGSSKKSKVPPGTPNSATPILSTPILPAPILSTPIPPTPILNAPNPPTPILSTPNPPTPILTIPNSPTTALSAPSEALVKEVTTVQLPNPTVPEPHQKVEPVPETKSEDAKKEDLKLMNSESTGSNTSEPRVEVSSNSQKAAETCAPERPDATPQQGSEPKVKLRKRLSLSTPRKGSHVRTLEFKTPPKGYSLPRKSASSPKHKVPDRLPQMHKMLQSVKKSELFKSPPKKDDKSWDADLRSVVSNPCEDIPTSVGLKRIEPVIPKNRRKSTPSKMETQPKTESSPKIPVLMEKSETTQDLVTQIQRDVLDVIDEEDFSDINSHSKSTDSVDSPKTKSPVKSPGTGSILEMGDIGVPPSTIKKLYPKRLPPGDENSSTLDSPISKVSKENFFVTPPRAQTPGVVTPSKIGKSPEKSLPNTPGSASLEATLIRECSRIESEGMERARVGSIFGSLNDSIFGEKSSEDSPNRANSFEEDASSRTPLLPPPKGILVLKTPAKSSLTIPVEMTPLSKIINEETRLSTLLTPTIPPTPDYEELKNQDPTKTEDKGSPPNVSSRAASPSRDSPKSISRKSQRVLTKTPLVRLRAKDPKPSASKNKTHGKKKGRPTEIDCNQLIAQCLQDVKCEVYGSSVPDSEDDKSQSAKPPEKKSPPSQIPRKKKVLEKKKPISYKSIANEIKRAEKSSKVIQPSLAEVIDRYEKENNFSSSSSDDSEMAKMILEKAKSCISGGTQTNSGPPESKKVSKIEEVDSVEVPKDDDVQDQKIKTIENTKSLDSQHVESVANVEEVDEIESPAASPRPVVSPVKLPTEKVDLDKFTFECAWLTDSGTVNTVLHTTPFLDIYSYPPVTASIKLSNEPGRSTVSSSVRHERGRRRRRSDSESGVEEESNERKRKRTEHSYEYISRPSPRRRGRGRPLQRSTIMSRRGAYQPEFRDIRGIRERSRRPSYKYSESSDSDKRRRSKSSSRRSSSYSRDRSRSRPGSECDDRRSPERSRSSKKWEESSSSTRKERPRTPSNEVRRGDRSPRESQSRKCSRQEVRADRGQQDLPPRKPSSHFEPPPARRPEKREPPPPVKDKIKVERSRQPHEFEEGEISDTSRSTILSISKNNSHFSGKSAARLSSPAADENRQALLQRVDLDQFLSYVHGEEKS